MAEFTATVVKSLDTTLTRKVVGGGTTSAIAEGEALAYSKITIGTITRSYKQAPFDIAPTTHAGTSDGTARFYFRDAAGKPFSKDVDGVSTAYLVAGTTTGAIDITDADIADLENFTQFPSQTGALTITGANFIKG